MYFEKRNQRKARIIPELANNEVQNDYILNLINLVLKLDRTKRMYSQLKKYLVMETETFFHLKLELFLSLHVIYQFISLRGENWR